MIVWIKELGEQGTDCRKKSRNRVDRYAKFATENLAFAASRIEEGKDRKVIPLSHFCHAKDANQNYKPSNVLS